MIVDASKGRPPTDGLPSFSESVAGSSSGSAPAASVAASIPKRSVTSNSEPVAAESIISHNELRLEPTGDLDLPPPEFTNWNAETRLLSGGNIVSHDPHLNEDGEALYRFLLASAREPPTFRLHCKGFHKETRLRVNQNHAHNHGNSHHHDHHHQGDGVRHVIHSGHTDIETILVTDFDFFIDLTEILGHARASEIWTISDDLPAFRGASRPEISTKAVPVYDPPNVFQRFGRWVRGGERRVRLADNDDLEASKAAWRRATKKERREMNNSLKHCANIGLPPWFLSDSYFAESRAPSLNSYTPMQSDLTVRAWADEYCASPKILKDFEFIKVVHGWDIVTLKASIEDLVRATGYRETTEINFETTANHVSIRPSNKLSRALSNKWIVALMWLFLVYPFVWIFKRWSKRGGGIWKVCGAAYSLKSQANVGALEYGKKEGTWLHEWEATIKHSVQAGVKATEPVWRRGGGAPMLDGYVDAVQARELARDTTNPWTTSTG